MGLLTIIRKARLKEKQVRILMLFVALLLSPQTQVELADT